MNKANMQALVAAMRSGKYDQIVGVLHITDSDPDYSHHKAGYCCLGLACEISGVGSWQKKPSDAYDPRIYYVTNPTDKFNGPKFDGSESDNSAFYMPPKVAQWLGLDNLNGDIVFSWNDRSRDPVRASRLNDDMNTFDQIADCIAWEFGL